jgi:undecaprenyl-diphosphatase
LKLIRLLRSWLNRLPLIEPVVLVVLIVGTSAAWGFIFIADEVREGGTQSFDRWALEILRNPDDPSDPIGPRWVEEMGRDATALGGVAWLSVTTLAIAGYLLLDGKLRMMLFMLGATGSGAVLSALLKTIYARPRPNLVPHLAQVYTSSFPSGHSMLSAVVYLTLGSLLAAVTPNKELKIYVMGVAVMLTIFVGASRVYLGVHYPSDVLAGWLAGLVWALVCWLFARLLQQRGQVEHEKPFGSSHQ